MSLTISKQTACSDPPNLFSGKKVLKRDMSRGLTIVNASLFPKDNGGDKVQWFASIPDIPCAPGKQYRYHLLARFEQSSNFYIFSYHARNSRLPLQGEKAIEVERISSEREEASSHLNAAVYGKSSRVFRRIEMKFGKL